MLTVIGDVLSGVGASATRWQTEIASAVTVEHEIVGWSQS